MTILHADRSRRSIYVPVFRVSLRSPVRPAQASVADQDISGYGKVTRSGRAWSAIQGASCGNGRSGRYSPGLAGRQGCAGQIWHRVTGSWVTVTGKRDELDLLITCYYARPSGASSIIYGHAAQESRGYGSEKPQKVRTGTHGRPRHKGQAARSLRPAAFRPIACQPWDEPNAGRGQVGTIAEPDPPTGPGPSAQPDPAAGPGPLAAPGRSRATPASVAAPVRAAAAGPAHPGGADDRPGRAGRRPDRRPAGIGRARPRHRTLAGGHRADCGSGSSPAASPPGGTPNGATT